MNDETPFLFVTCQAGVQWALKADVARQYPEFRFAFSRPGLVTFKLPHGIDVDHVTLDSAFARTYGESLGQVEGKASKETANAVAALLGDRRFKQLHVWQRDSAVPGHRGFTPGVTSSIADAAEEFAVALRGEILPEGTKPNQIARRSQPVLDLIDIDPEHWLVGRHLADRNFARWPAGVPVIRRPDEMVSRAYLKMQEALAWSRFPLNEKEPWVELGSSPGGACQALLERGLHVTGIDPAPMHEWVMKHEHFRHIQKRSDDVRLKEFRPFRWLTADLNVAPQTTLDAIERIISAGDVNLRGMLLTLKLLDRSMFSRVNEYRQRVLDWGFELVRVRQLAFNRREFCLAAVWRRSTLRSPAKRRRAKKNRE